MTFEDALPHCQHSCFCKSSPHVILGVCKVGHCLTHGLSLRDLRLLASPGRGKTDLTLSHEHCTWFHLPTCQQELFLKVRTQIISLGSLCVCGVINSKGGGELQDSQVCVLRADGNFGDDVGPARRFGRRQEGSQGSNY